MGLFSANQDVLELKDIVESVTKGLPSRDRNKFKEAVNWKELFKIAQKFDYENNEKKMLSENLLKKPQTVELKSKGKEIKCYKCGGPHYKIKCPDLVKENNPTANKKVFTISVDEESVRPIIPFNLKGELIRALLDSGANVNCISSELAKKLKLNIITTRNKLRFGQGFGDSDGIVNLQLRSKCNKYQEELEFYLVNNLAEDMLIGIESMRKLKIFDILKKQKLAYSELRKSKF